MLTLKTLSCSFNISNCVYYTKFQRFFVLFILISGPKLYFALLLPYVLSLTFCDMSIAVYCLWINKRKVSKRIPEAIILKHCISPLGGNQTHLWAHKLSFMTYAAWIRNNHCNSYGELKYGFVCIRTYRISATQFFLQSGLSTCHVRPWWLSTWKSFEQPELVYTRSSSDPVVRTTRAASML